jgi:hypothetical protein
MTTSGLKLCGWMALAIMLLFPLPASAADTGSGKQETVCLQCHGDQSGMLGKSVTLWRKSIHAANNISCHDCHGGDPSDSDNAMNPERGFLSVPEEKAIPAFCGRCHVGVREDYLASDHGQALGDGGPQCVTCHGNHAVRRASLELINQQTCTQCHSFKRAAIIKGALVDTDGKITTLEQNLAELRRVGISVKSMEGQLFALRNDFHRLFHSVDVKKVRSETSRFQKGLGKISDKIALIRNKLAKRKFWGGAAVLLLVFAGLIFILLRRTYQNEGWMFR